MAEDFNKFLENGVLTCKDVDTKCSQVPIVIATIIGKETSDNTKYDIINRYLGKEVFTDEWCIEDDKKIAIAVFYDETESVLWLILNGVNDVFLQYQVFGSGLNGESFFEKLSEVEDAQHRFLLLLFSISHLVIFVEQACRFDLDLINLLEDVNRNRLKSVSMIKTALLDRDNCIMQKLSFLSKNGRIAVPYMLFCFYRNPLRNDLSSSKKKELLEKMEKCMESQVSHFLRQHGVIDNRYSENALGQITISSGAPFVYIFNHDELPKDANNEFVLSLYPEESSKELNADNVQQLIESVLGLSPKNKEFLSRSDYNFDYFLHSAILNVRKRIEGEMGSDEDTSISLSDFVQVAKFLKRMFVEGTGGYSVPISRHSLQEIDTLNSIIDSSIGVAVNLYTNQLNQQPDVTGGGDLAFSQLEHDYTIKVVIEQLKRRCPKALGKAKQNKMIERVREECTALWVDGHQRCEKLSLTGQLCHFTIHDLPSDSFPFEGSRSRDDKRSPREHCSGVKTYSMCNCGLSRQIRRDPFSLMEANYTFYQKSDLTFANCCADLDRYEFRLFSVRDLPNCSVKVEDDLNMTMVDDSQSLKGPSPNGLRRRENEANVEEEEAVAIDPHEFNVRFFDDQDGDAAQIPSDDGEEFDILGEQNNETVSIVPMTQDEGMTSSKVLSGDDNEEDEEDVEEEHRRKERIESTEEDEELDEEGEELTKQSGEEDSSRPMTPSKNVDYLESYDVYEQGKRERASNEKGILSLGRQRTEDVKLLEQYKGLYLEHVPHSKSPPDLLPLFPSFSVICIGHSSLYNHSTGIRESPNFRSGSEFLLPWGVQLTVRTEQWLRELQFIGATPTERTFRTLQQQQQRNFERASFMTSKEKVKLFIGFDYECPRGHRFMVVEPGKVLRHRRVSGTLKTDAAPLMDNDLPIWMPCPCKKEPRMAAQLMRIHIVTPKAPVSVSIQPLIQMSTDDGEFFPGQKERIELGWAKYYVMRLPYIYVGPSGIPFHRPNVPEYRGKLLRRCIQVEYLPLSDV